ncbi:gliding motility-associated C-terminal domain-containing protein [Dokdonia sinensis]|uniref:Gliding motility-associated C-terminal domain-containing protein n=1 Tax=Dokdonia sinensis TaxID=2479847 RepID=A0A3M0FUA8_9FLAO|nr:gliding motility-associated C-terminal domain-containing protein [Dokdonia sinensis]RMB56098.1 gliding motility-associated C-terminal domain-containing protein [Dokdonia sinensis]
MKEIISIFIIFGLITSVMAQEALHNFGNLQVHEGGQLGFHGDLINDGDFDDNLGLVGFYHEDNGLRISGTRIPVFFNMESDVPNDLTLDVSVGVINFMDFIDGRVLTPRNNTSVTLDFIDNSLYDGENDDRHVDGYASTSGELDYRFPIGDDFRLRPLSVSASPNNGGNIFNTAYFFEDPNNPTTFTASFNTDALDNTLAIVSTEEFWDLNGSAPVEVTLTWDNQSNVPALTDNIANLRVVGYSIAMEQWVDLGNTASTGTLDSGEITSSLIEPNLYEIITLGSAVQGNAGITVFTGMSPNGDGLNEFFVIEGIEDIPNTLRLYNRWGLEVFSMENYDNSFNGESDGRFNIDGNNQLPVGTYYYVLELEGRKDLAGAFYITR